MAKPDPVELEQAFQTLANTLRNHHGVLRGTAEAVLAEAQGLRLLVSSNPSQNPAYHLNSLQQAAASLRNALAAIDKNLLAIRNEDLAAYKQALRGMSGLLNLARTRLQLLGAVEELATELSITNHSRLTGMSRMVVTAARDMRGLVSSQLSRLGLPLVPPGIAQSAQAVLRRIRSMPIHPSAAAAHATAAATALRALLRSPMFVSTLSRALGVAASVVTRIFGTLTSVIIIVAPPDLADPRARRLDHT